MSTKIHPAAVVDPQARIGQDVTIGPFAVIEGDVEIGDRSTIGPHAHIADGTRMGSECHIFTGAAISNIPQDLKFHGEKTLMRIGDRTTIREYCTLNRGTSASGETSIGNDCLIMTYGHVGHDCAIGNRVICSNNLAMAGHVTVMDNVTISAFAGIHQFTRIGPFAYIASSVRVLKDVVPFALCANDPLRVMGINKIGLERHGFSAERRQDIKRAYRILFRQNLMLDDALSRLATEFKDNEDVGQIIDFVKGSQRSFTRMDTMAVDEL